jgi:hypothetical protein
VLHVALLVRLLVMSKLGVANRVCVEDLGVLPALHVGAGDGFEVHVWCAWQALR